MKDLGSHYEYLFCYVDDLLIASKNPKAIMDELRKAYAFKDIGLPDYYLGAGDYGRVKGDFTENWETSTT